MFTNSRLMNRMSRWFRKSSRVPTVRRNRLGVNRLEERLTPYSVTNLNNSGVGSLRQAIIDANANAGPDVIDFASGLEGAIYLTSGELSITDAVTITGPGAVNLAIDAQQNSRIFNTAGAPTAAAISISGLSITGGKVSNNNGGGIAHSDQKLSLSNVAIINCASQLGDGGALSNLASFGSGTVTLTDCTIRLNSAANQGGAIRGTAVNLTLTRCTVADNYASTNGGGIVTLGSGSLTIDASTISGNSSTYGGGLFFSNTTVNITNSTIANNTAATTGGGIQHDQAGALNISNSTIARNTATSGGGISGNATLESSILAENTAGTGPDSDAVLNANYSLIGNTTGASVSGNNNLPNVYPMLGTFALHGGQTKTYSLLLGSPAINQGSNPLNLTYDQRYTNVYASHPRVAGAQADIGAVEACCPEFLVSNVFNTGVDNSGMPLPDYSPDPHYQVVVGPSGYTGTSLAVPPQAGVWIPQAASPTSRWITPPSLGAPANTYTYETTFDLSGFDPNTAVITGRWATDDEGIDIRLNGQRAYAPLPGYPGFQGYSLASEFEIANGTGSSVAQFVQGINTLRFTVHNGSMPTGLRVDKLKIMACIPNLVDDISDVVDGDYGIGKLSLREAILLANADPGADTISFHPSVFANLATITLTAGQMDISDGLTINGPTSGLVINAAGLSRIFSTASAPAGTEVALKNMTLTNGFLNSGTGAGIQTDNESLSLTNVTISNCVAAYHGGGVFVNNYGKLTLDRSRILNNQSSSGRGGGIAAAGNVTLTFRDTTISGNTAAGSGGGIDVDAGGDVTIDGSTVSGNTSNNNGGGVYLLQSKAVIRNSTISGNSAQSFGGIFVSGTFAVTISNCTIAQNTVSGNAGGIGIYFSNPNLTLTSSIVANNFAAGSGPDVFGNVSIDYSLIGNSAGMVILSGANNQLDVDPLLAPLGNNGGPTLTHALPSNSPAINSGSNPAGLIHEQRGAPLARNYNGVDIGAYEAQPRTFVVTNDSDSGMGSLRQAILNANSNFGLDSITFDSVFFSVPRTIVLSTGQLQNTDQVIIAGPGAGLATVSGNNVSRILDTQLPIGNLPVTISGLTFAFGLVSGANDGAAIIAANQNLTLSNCTFQSNSSGRSGGVISVSLGTLTATDCTFINNTAATNGGAIHVLNADTTLRRCTISGNTAGSTGGGIYTYNLANLLIEGCTLSANKASTATGGALNHTRQSGTNTVIIRNSTVSGNTSGTDGGGLAMNLGVDLVVQNSTLTANSAGGLGGAIAGSAIIASSILFGNQASVSAPEISAGAVTVTTSLIASTSGVTAFSADTFTNANIGVNPLLGPLANNGGPTKSHAYPYYSIAVNNGSNPAGLTNDQRGLARVEGGSPDIGSLELKAPPTIDSVIFGDGTNQRSLVKQIVVNFSEAVNFMGSVASAFTLSRTGTGGSTGNVTLSAAPATGPASVVTITFSGSLTEFDSLIDGFYDLLVNAAQVSGIGGALDGNYDEIPGGSYLEIGTLANKRFRYFGDSDGNGAVTQTPDFIEFRNAFGVPNAIFDFDTDGALDQDDFIKFRNNFSGVP